MSVVTVLLTIPLNRMVGREFVPNEDMGEWTIHADAPEGTSLSGTTDVAFRLAPGDQRHRGRGGHRAIRRRVRCHGRRRRPTSISSVRRSRSASARTPRREIITEMRRRLAAHQSFRPSITSRNALGSGEGTGGFRDFGEHPRSGSRADCRLFEARARRGAERAEHYGIQGQPERLEPGGARRRRSQAGRRSRRPDVDDRQHAAPRGLGRRSDFLLQGRAGAVPGQDPRARGPAGRHRPDRPARPCRRPPARCASTISPGWSAASGRPRCSVPIDSSRSCSSRMSHRATPSTKPRMTSARCWPASTCRSTMS